MSDDSDQTQSLNQVYRKVIEWKISEKEDDEEEDRDSAYNSSIRSHFQSVLSSSSLSQSLRKGKVPALHLVPGEKYNCSISSVFSPTSFRLRRDDENFFKLTRYGVSCNPL